MLRSLSAVSALLVVVFAGCDLLVPPAPIDGDGNGRPRGDECDRDSDCDGGEFCDDGDCAPFNATEGEGDVVAEGEGEPPPPPPPTCDGAGCPEILSLTTNRANLDERSSATVSAVVTDPDGVADVIGGVLIDPVSQGTYGTFIATGAGTFDINVSWSVLGAVRVVDVNGSANRVVRARFFDQGGNDVFGDVTFTLACSDDVVACEGSCGSVRCEGTCTEPNAFDNNNNCGSCGNVCTAPDTCTFDQVGGTGFSCTCEGPDCNATTPGTPYVGTRENGVVCGTAGTCSDACCIDLSAVPTCAAPGGSCLFAGGTCDGPEDCADSEECCFAGFASSCVPTGECRAGGNREVCVNENDCAFDELCCASSTTTLFGGDAGVCATALDTGECPSL